MPTQTAPHVAALLDLDGTLVDSNYQHALAWYGAFRDQGIVLPVWRLHRHVGMGGDQLVAAVAGEQVEKEHGDELREGHGRHYHRLIAQVELMPDAQRLITTLNRRGNAVVLASSADEKDLEHYRSLLDVDELLAGATSGSDVERTKPDPDLITAAMDQVPDAGRSVMVGDSTWDCRAAQRAGIDSVALLTGGFSEQELREAGASAVFASIGELLEHIDETPLA